MLRNTWQGFGAFWSVMWAQSPIEKLAALGVVLDWIERAADESAARDVEVAGAVKALAKELNQ